MEKQPDEEQLENLYFRQLKKFDKLKVERNMSLLVIDLVKNLILLFLQ